METFYYKKKELFCEDVAVNDVIKKVGTPCYIYSKKAFTENFLSLKRALKSISPLICFAVKANSNLAILKLMGKSGSGMDIVSAGELYRALKAGVSPKKIVFAGVGKTPSEIVYAIKNKILLFNVESLDELLTIDSIAQALKAKVKVAIRINPDIPVDTHKYVATGKGDSKFGIDFGQAEKIFQNKEAMKSVDICGIHLHVGSQLVTSKPFIKAIKKTLAFIKKNGISLKYLNIGGGLGITYDKEKPQTAKEYASKILPLLKNQKFKVILEPGRFISGNSGALISRAIYTKKTTQKYFTIVDAGMNDLLRPSIYSAYHKILPVETSKRSKVSMDIVGPICESGDFFAKNRELPEIQPGELIAVLGAGAYGFVMASNYNSRGKPCEVLVDKKKFTVVRRRETFEDLIRGESLKV